MYANLLRAGCRALTLNIRDGSHGEPVLLVDESGNSLLASDVLSALKEAAFQASPYPVILSLDIEMCLSQQEKLAAHLLRIL